MVDIAAVVADRHGVQDVPSCGELGQFTADLLLTLRADSPRSFIGLHAERSRDKVPHRSLAIDLLALRLRSGAGRVVAEVVARGRRNGGRWHWSLEQS